MNFSLESMTKPAFDQLEVKEFDEQAIVYRLNLLTEKREKKCTGIHIYNRPDGRRVCETQALELRILSAGGADCAPGTLLVHSQG